MAQDKSRTGPEQQGDYAQTALAVARGEVAWADAGGRFGATCYGDLSASEVPDGARRASLACGNPVAVVDLQDGDVVLDLGSGGGLDVLLSARRVAPHGKAIGVDMTPEMLEMARRHAAEAGVGNVEFLEGRIEALPLPDASVDVITSNCVITLSADKPAVFSEMRRVLRPGGRIGISDVVAEDRLCPVERMARGTSENCLGGALTFSEYRDGLSAAGFVEVGITPTHPVADGAHTAVIRARLPMRLPCRVEPMGPEHASAVLRIHGEGIATGDATFDTEVPAWAEWDAGHLEDHRLVAIDESGELVGWAAVAPVSDRCAYRGVVEHSLYVAQEARGRSVGALLLDALIASTESAGIWTIQAGVLPENTASLRLHERCGFRQVGVRERVGQHHGVWRDVILLERRSPHVI